MSSSLCWSRLARLENVGSTSRKGLLSPSPSFTTFRTYLISNVAHRLDVMHNLSQNLRYALRSLARSPRLTTAAVVTLALGIGANTAIFGIVDSLFFQVPPQVRDPHEIVRVFVRQGDPVSGQSIAGVATYPRYADLRDHARGFAALAACATERMNLGRGTEAQQVSAKIVTGSFFPLLDVRPAVGRFFSLEEDRLAARVVVLGFEFWRRRFGGDSSIVGRGVLIGASLYTVVGIAPEGFTGIDMEPVDIWLPVGAVAVELARPLSCKACYWLTTVGRIRSTIARERIVEEATAVYRFGAAAEPADTSAVVVLGPIQAARGPAASSNAKLSVQLAVVSLLVLLIACANVVSLLLARAVQRQREIAIRLAVGASRRHIVQQLLTEGLVIALLGGIAALLLSAWGGSLLATHLLPKGVGRGILSARMFAFTAILVLLSGIAANLIPALRASRPDLTTALKAGTRDAGVRQSRLRALLVVTQVALTLVLLVGAGLFIRSLRNVSAIPLGFDPEHLISATADLRQFGYRKPEIDRLYEQMRSRVVQLPGVTNASLAIGSPFAISMAIGLAIPGVDDSLLRGRDGVPYIQVVSYEYFRTLGTAVRNGRTFSSFDRLGSPRVVILNETMAHRLWPSRDALGKCIKIGGGEDVPCSEVIGIVEDVRRNVITERPTMQYYAPLSQMDTSFLYPVTALLVRTVGSPEEILPAVRREIQAVSTDLPYVDVQPMRNVFEWQLHSWKLGSLLFSLFGVLALALAAIGLYGLLAYVVAQRTREIGVRMALGAQGRDVLLLIIRQGLGVAAAGVAIGGVTALLAGRSLASMLYGVSPADVMVVGSAGLVLLAVSFLASYVPARRAVSVDPASALYSE